jgi:hypothetical protein
VNPVGTQRLRFTAQVNTFSNVTADVLAIRLMDGSTQVWEWTKRANSGTANAATTHTHNLIAELNVAAGARTYTITVLRALGTGTTTITANALWPNFLSIDVIG